MKFAIKHRQTGGILFEAELSAVFEFKSLSVRLGAAVKLAVEARADLARADLAGAYLADADLAGANLARADLAGADLAGAHLARAHLARADLARADLAGADLAGAYLARADLADADLAGAYLADADLAGANLAGANLAGAYLARADLAGADLAGANLAGANLAGAYLARADLADANKEPIDVPVIEKIDAQILAAVKAGGELNMSAWHGHGRCGTTHCRAGWAIHLAGDRGYALEAQFGSQRAGAMIYRASRPGQPAPWFFDTDERALEDIRKCAAEQAGVAPADAEPA